MQKYGTADQKLICASNDNKVLYDFFRTGAYDRNRDFILTTSPSMDILISSNLERLIYRIAGEDAACNASLMAALAGDGKYEITAEMKEKLGDFTEIMRHRRNARRRSAACTKIPTMCSIRIPRLQQRFTTNIKKKPATRQKL